MIKLFIPIILYLISLIFILYLVIDNIINDNVNQIFNFIITLAILLPIIHRKRIHRLYDIYFNKEIRTNLKVCNYINYFSCFKIDNMTFQLVLYSNKKGIDPDRILWFITGNEGSKFLD